MDIKNSPSGDVVRVAHGCYAFVPHSLPPVLAWTDELVSLLSRADFVVGQLAYQTGKLPNPKVLMRPFVVREAVLSSRIEGTQTTLGQVLVDQAGYVSEGRSRDMHEVKNYLDALDYGVRRLDDIPLSLRLIKEIHGKLMHGVRGGHADPGNFRRVQNWIGIPGCTIDNAHYVPPPAERLMDALGNLEIFLHDTTLPPLIHAALCHYQFEALHPFLDGNGRMGRLLITLLLAERKVLPAPILYLSAFFESTRDEYYRQLYNVSASGTWHAWLAYFLNGVYLQAGDVVSRAERINAVIDDWQHHVSTVPSSTISSVVGLCVCNPFLTAHSSAAALNITFTAAQRALAKLEKLGILSEVSQGTRGRVYCAKKILEILDKPTNIANYDEPRKSEQ